jgi:hypothetical protein
VPPVEPERAAKPDVSTDRVVTVQWFQRLAQNDIFFAIAVAGPVQKEGPILVVFVHDQLTVTARWMVDCGTKSS